MSTPAKPDPKPKHGYALQSRLLWGFGLLLLLFMGLTGLVLDRAFKQSVAAAVDERLLLQVYALLGAAETDASGFFLPDLEEARFSRLNSGLYGFILSPSNSEVWRSPSALNLDLQELELRLRPVAPGTVIYGRANTSLGSLSYASYGTFWESLGQQYRFVVLESADPTDAEVRAFQNNLWFWLGGLGVLLILVQLLLLRWGLRPLQTLASDLSAIETGQQDQLAAHYPRELTAVTANLNELIKTERERQVRYRTTLDDLAHSLKTPLAVISGIVQQSSGKLLRDKEATAEIEEQVSRMNQIISYQLKRAVKSEQTRLLARPVRTAPLISRIAAALGKVYFEKKPELTLQLDEAAIFYGDESDLTEVVGNLLDNAFKYCHSKVSLKTWQEARNLFIEVSDDGKGIAEENRHWVLERGARADTVEKGQGIGLAVTRDIISSYGGNIQVSRSVLGGACVRVVMRLR